MKASFYTVLLVIFLSFPVLALAVQDTTDSAVVYNKEDGARLVGTWLAPDNTVPKAAIALATGSGQQDRDETLFGHKPFRAIAERLADEGYAVLRLDDRGVGGSTGEVICCPAIIIVSSNAGPVSRRNT